LNTIVPLNNDHARLLILIYIVHYVPRTVYVLFSRQLTRHFNPFQMLIACLNRIRENRETNFALNSIVRYAPNRNFVVRLKLFLPPI